MITKKINLKYEDNVAVISDLQIPFHHKDAFDFLRFVKKEFKITKWVCVGDEVDQSFLSYHEKDPNGDSAKEEIRKGRLALKELATIVETNWKKQKIKDFLIAWSNHGALHLRKAKTAGIPDDYIKSPNEVWGVPKSWKWFDEIVLKYPHQPEILIKHQMSNNSKNNVLSRQCSVITGHFHTTMDLICRTNHYGQLMFGAIIGCLIDRFHPTFGYASNQKDVQQLGILVLVSGSPVLVPMWVDKNNRWIGPKLQKKKMK